MEGWCDILMLQMNVKNCSARGTGTTGVLSVAIARKFYQSLAEAHRIDFSYRVAAVTPDYLAVHLGADSGPLGTKNYRIVLEATPLDAKRSFLRMSYSYGYGVAGRVAMQTYLATSGRDKVGFTVVERKDGTPVYVAGERGMIERAADFGITGTVVGDPVRRRLRAGEVGSDNLDGRPAERGSGGECAGAGADDVVPVHEDRPLLAEPPE